MVIVHIVFDDADAAALKKSFELDPSMEGEVIVVQEDWSIGPLMGTIGEEGTIGRNGWMERLFGLKTESNPVEDIGGLLNQDEASRAWIWISPNSRDVCGYYYLISNLRKYQGRVETIWLNNLPFINENGQIFYPDYLKKIPAKEFVKAKKLTQIVSGAVFETDPDEWDRMRKENTKLRILEGAKKISGRPDTYFDKRILSQLSAEWKKSTRVIQHVLSESKDTINALFLLWRIRELIHGGLIEAKGDWPGSDNFEVRKLQIEQPTAEHE